MYQHDSTAAALSGGYILSPVAVHQTYDILVVVLDVLYAFRILLDVPNDSFHCLHGAVVGEIMC